MHRKHHYLLSPFLSTVQSRAVPIISSIAAIIAGTTFGSVHLVALATLFFLRRRKMRSGPRILIDEIDDDFTKSNKFRNRNDLRERHRPEPFPLIQAVLLHSEKLTSSFDPRISKKQFDRRVSRPPRARILVLKERNAQT